MWLRIHCRIAVDLTIAVLLDRHRISCAHEAGATSREKSGLQNFSFKPCRRKWFGSNLKDRPGTQRSTEPEVKGYLLPTAPSDLLANHHFPCLSRTSKSSPLANGISSGSSAEPCLRVSANASKMYHWATYKRREPWLRELSRPIPERIRDAGVSGKPLHTSRNQHFRPSVAGSGLLLACSRVSKA